MYGVEAQEWISSLFRFIPDDHCFPTRTDPRVSLLHAYIESLVYDVKLTAAITYTMFIYNSIS
jgi:hypothetical protein